VLVLRALVNVSDGTNPPIKHTPGNGRYSEKPANPVLTGKNPELVGLGEIKMFYSCA